MGGTNWKRLKRHPLLRFLNGISSCSLSSGTSATADGPHLHVDMSQLRSAGGGFTRNTEPDARPGTQDQTRRSKVWLRVAQGDGENGRGRAQSSRQLHLGSLQLKSRSKLGRCSSAQLCPALPTSPSPTGVLAQVLRTNAVPPGYAKDSTSLASVSLCICRNHISQA